LERGADGAIANKKGRNAVHAAAYNNLTEALRWLIKDGADVNAKVCHKGFAMVTPKCSISLS
jgi:ankyrin repeat protein